jgi:hypothetical protein
MISMTEDAAAIEIVCGLCPCHFSAADLNEDDILCSICGHSLDDDHAAAAPPAETERA